MGPRGGRWALLPTCFLLLLAPLFSGCSPQNLAQANAATATTLAQPSASLSPTAPQTASSPVAGTATASVEGTLTPRPTPAGTPPAPFSVLSILLEVPTGGTLVRRDSLQLDPPGADAGEDEVLFTVAGASREITQEGTSALGV
ncbi:MAG TPA: hypothetical protein VM409_04825, partial [Chloroflexia bacterium]|nr:hypothetical protein [Chloroflexia bacterium]